MVEDSRAGNEREQFIEKILSAIRLGELPYENAER
jgi:hypothetical protein